MIAKMENIKRLRWDEPGAFRYIHGYRGLEEQPKDAFGLYLVIPTLVFTDWDDGYGPVQEIERVYLERVDICVVQPDGTVVVCEDWVQKKGAESVDPAPKIFQF